MAKPQRPYKLCYLPLFWDDLNSAVSYISDVLKAPKAADDLLDKLETEILSHLENPALALVYKTSKKRPQLYYWFAAGNYMVFYVIEGEFMEVRRFLYGARDLTRMLP